MGLAGVKKSTRIGLDPRNTKWINNENGIGHKLLAAQGWTPGQGLGDSMKGRTVNIKTTYKDNTAGIGCSAQHAQEWSGLSAFNDIFTRINNDEIGTSLHSDPGLKNKDRVIFMETKSKPIGLDARFVKGEVFTSEMSKAEFLESLGVRTIEGTLDSREAKRLKKAAKLARRAKRAQKELQRRLKETEKNAKKSRKAERKADTPVHPPTSESAPEVSNLPSNPVITTRPVHGRFASRAKYQKAKLGSRLDAAQLAEILGIKQS